MDPMITAFDLERMLIGDEPPLFLLEIAVRTVIIYGYTLFLLRWLGSRTIGQLSTVEFLLVIALGSAVGDAMFYAEVPLLHAMLVVTIVVVTNKALDMLIARSKRAERIIDGDPREAVRDGVLSTEFLKNKTVSRDELFQQLREAGIEQLGQVWRAYIEKDGKLTVFRVEGDAPAGLRIVPPFQLEPPKPIDPRTEAKRLAHAVCTECGSHYGGDIVCVACGKESWTLSALHSAR